jgi:osmotically inducible lipoprotein OsmB
MRKYLMIGMLAAVTGLSACQMGQLGPTERALLGGAAGAVGGLAIANLMGANSNWKILGAVAGATAGTLLAQNMSTGRCAYARGDGTYYEAPCP